MDEPRLLSGPGAFAIVAIVVVTLGLWTFGATSGAAEPSSAAWVDRTVDTGDTTDTTDTAAPPDTSSTSTATTDPETTHPDTTDPDTPEPDTSEAPNTDEVPPGEPEDSGGVPSTPLLTGTDPENAQVDDIAPIAVIAMVVLVAIAAWWLGTKRRNRPDDERDHDDHHPTSDLV